MVTELQAYYKKRLNLAFYPTEEQAVFNNTVQNTNKSVFLNACAGSGKTTTITMGVKLVPVNKKIVVLAFNSKIAKKLNSLLPSRVEVKTMHSLGFKVLRDTVGYRKASGASLYFAAKNACSDIDPSESYSTIKKVEKLIDIIKNSLIDNNEDLKKEANKHGYIVSDDDCKRAFLGNKLTFDKKRISFNDMVYLPVVKNWNVPKYDYIFIDEAQDLSKAQLSLVQKMINKDSRVFFIGDNNQTIYGFAGADTESFMNIPNMFQNIEKLDLSLTQRCSQGVVDYINAKFPHIKFNAVEGAENGSVNTQGSVKDIKDGSMVLARKNAPLVKLCLELIKDHKKASVKGKEIGLEIINMIEKHNATSIRHLKQLLEADCNNLITKLCKIPKMTEKKAENNVIYKNLKDKVEVIYTIIDNISSPSINKLKRTIKNIYRNDIEGILLSTVHKAKGLEANVVHIIESKDLYSNLSSKKYDKLKAWERTQEINVEYVAYSRAIKNLNIITDWEYKEKKVKEEEKEEVEMV